MHPALKTIVDTVVTTGVIAPQVYDSQPAMKEIFNSHDFTAPVIALVSSLVIQGFIKMVKFFAKKWTNTDLDATT